MGAEIGRYRHVNQPERKKRGKELAGCCAFPKQPRRPASCVLTTSFSSPVSTAAFLLISAVLISKIQISTCRYQGRNSDS